MRHLLLAPALLALSAAACAQDSGRPLWEIGGVALGVSQQAYPGSSQQVNRAIALPYLIYRGQYLRADNDGIGVRAIKTPRYEFDVSAAGAFGSSADRDPARRGMPSLGTLVEFGPRLKVDLGAGPAGGRWRLDLPVRGVFDLSHHLRYQGAVFQPGVTWSRRAPGALLYGAGASLLFANERLASTFYDVEPRYATPTRPAYEARAGLLATRVSAFFGKDLTRDWTLFGFAQVNSVAGAANRDSPLVRQVTGHTIGIGLSYTWLRSEARAADRRHARRTPLHPVAHGGRVAREHARCKRQGEPPWRIATSAPGRRWPPWRPAASCWPTRCAGATRRESSSNCRTPSTTRST